MIARKQQGFTLIELLLAMAFISFLLLFVVNSVIQITRIYTKGLAIRQISQTGRQLTEDVSRSLRYGEPLYLAANNRLCSGGVSYIWNPEGDTTNKFTDNAPVRFVSVDDPGHLLCNTATLPQVDRTRAEDLVGKDITVMEFSVQERGKLRDIKLVLSTAGSNVAMADSTTPTGFSCDPKNEFCAFGDFETD
jgi:prepilin-type N-terminal cleavage/methylation domain-containing protein